MASRITRPYFVVLVTLCLGLWAPIPVNADVSVLAIERDRTSLEQTDEIDVFRLGTPDRMPLKRGASLAVGDRLLSRSTNVTVQLVCPGGSLVTLTDPLFHVLIVRAVDRQDCSFSLLNGRVHFLSTQPTAVGIGEVSLSTKRTQYEVSVKRDEHGATEEIIVYDDEVYVSSPTLRNAAIEFASGEYRTVNAESKLYLSRTMATYAKVSSDDIGKAADLYARVDVSRLNMEKVKTQPKILYGQLKKLYGETLDNPSNPRARLDLAVHHINHHLPEAAILQLELADRDPDRDREISAMITLSRAIAYYALDKRGLADTLRRQAEELDPGIASDQNLARYKFDPERVIAVVRATVSAAERQLSLNLQSHSITRTQGEPVEFDVTVLSGQGEPVSGATLLVVVRQGPRFRNVTAETNPVKTDERGMYRVWFKCRPCERRYRIDIQASMPGYELTQDHVIVTINRD